MGTKNAAMPATVSIRAEITVMPFLPIFFVILPMNGRSATRGTYAIIVPTETNFSCY